MMSNQESKQEKTREGKKLAMFDIDHHALKEKYWSGEYDAEETDRLERLGAPQRVIRNLRNPKPSVELVANFLLGISDDDGWEEIKESLKGKVSYAPRGMISDLKALENILSTPQEKDVYAKLVAWDFNWSLDDPSDENAKAHLQILADMMRQALGDLAPPQS